MRELKFRAWDKKEKKMLYGVSIGTYKVWDENTPLLNDEFSYSEDCIFEQYTGLKDKNGKEIYEGDIIKFDDIDEEAEVTASAVVVEENGAYVTRCHDGELYITKDGIPAVLGFIKNELYQGIGNIHENPELLEEK